MQEKRRISPIFIVMKRIMEKKVDAPEIISALTLKMSKEQQQYFMVSLKMDTQPERLLDSECQILDHHISVYETYNDKVFVLSAYHYTAKILVDGHQYTLHCYFNKFGQLLDYLVNDVSDEIVKNLDEWHDIFRNISIQYTIDILCHLFHTLERLSSMYDQRLQVISSEIDALSELLYGDEIETTSTHELAENYLSAIRSYIDCRQEYNEVSLHPDHAKIKFLNNVIINFKVPQTTHRTVVKKLPNRSTLKTSTAQSKPKEKVRKPVAEKYCQIMPLIPPEIQKLLSRLEELEKTNTAQSILDQHHLLKTCASRMTEVPDNVAMDIFIKQNQILKKVSVALRMFIQLGNVESVTLLLTLTKDVNHSMVCDAAMKGHIAVLSLLLNHYKGPKRFFYNNDNVFRELVCEEKLPTVSLQTLLNYGCDKRSIDIYGRSLLLIAVMLDDLERVRMLLEANVDVNLHTNKNIHKINSKPFISFPDNIQLSKKTTQSIKQFLTEFESTQETLLNQSVQILTLTPIMCAAQRGKLPIIRLLCEHHCDLSERDDTGFNAYAVVLIRPVTNPHYRLKEDVIQYFIDECHLDINMLHGHAHMRKTALHHAVYYRGYADTDEHAAAILNDIEILLKFNADPNVLSLDEMDSVGDQQLSAFCLAVYLNYSDVVDLIFQKSRVLISNDTIKHAALIVHSLRPDQLPNLREQFDTHFNRLIPPLPRFAYDPNAFFTTANSNDESDLANTLYKGSY